MKKFCALRDHQGAFFSKKNLVQVVKGDFQALVVVELSIHDESFTGLEGRKGPGTRSSVIGPVQIRSKRRRDISFFRNIRKYVSSEEKKRQNKKES